ncbi:MAG: energy transducer TonB [Prevotella sp.]|nr:energy transducer TonB [Prevotella sp.]
MMNLFLTYELKVALLIAVFYVFWRLLAANETWHKLNRIVLLSTAIASFVLPLCVITLHKTIKVEPQFTEMTGNEAEMIESESKIADGKVIITPDKATTDNTMSAISIPNDTEEASKPINWPMILTTLYIIGVTIVLSRMLLSLWKLHQMKQNSEIHPMSDGHVLAVSELASQPFSWWNTVFLNRKDFEEGTTALLTHELGHIRLHHSADVVLVELLTALQWFNPTMWMLRNDLRIIHEYEADQQVLSHGFSDIQYLQLLIRKAASQGGYSLANGIANQSTLKKRVTMMMKQKSNRWQWLRLAYLLPIIAVSLYTSAETKVDYQTKEESAITLKVKDGKECIGVKAPVGAFFSWLINGRLAERGDVKEDSRWNTTTFCSPDEFMITLDGQEITKNNIPYVPLSSIKELKFLQGEHPRRIELYTRNVSGFDRSEKTDWPSAYKDNVKRWMFVTVEDAATGRLLKGAEVTVDETGQKDLTNEEGWCELKIALGTTLRASYPGFETQTVKVDKMSGNEILGHPFRMNKPGEHIYWHRDVDHVPEFIGDKVKWCAEHARLSDASRSKGLHNVRVFAVINEDGSVNGTNLMQGVRKDLNDEALRLVSSMPHWKPALKDGKPVRCKTIVVVNFE